MPESYHQEAFSLGPLPARVRRHEATALEVIHRAVLSSVDPAIEGFGIRGWAERRDSGQVKASLARKIENGGSRRVRRSHQGGIVRKREKGRSVWNSVGLKDAHASRKSRNSLR